MGEEYKDYELFGDKKETDDAQSLSSTVCAVIEKTQHNCKQVMDEPKNKEPQQSQQTEATTQRRQTQSLLAVANNVPIFQRQQNVRQNSFPGAYAIPGIAAVSAQQQQQQQQDGGVVTLPSPLLLPPILYHRQEHHEEEVLVRASIVVEESPANDERSNEQPTIIFEAAPLRTGNWYWIIAMAILVFALSFVLALLHVQASKFKRLRVRVISPDNNNNNSTNNDAAPVTITATDNTNVFESQFSPPPFLSSSSFLTLPPSPVPSVEPLQFEFLIPSLTPSKHDDGNYQMSTPTPTITTTMMTEGRVQNETIVEESQPPTTSSISPREATPAPSPASSIPSTLQIPPTQLNDDANSTNFANDNDNNNDDDSNNNNNNLVAVGKATTVGNGMFKGASGGDKLGRNIKLSEDGQIMAVSSHLYDCRRNGRVFVDCGRVQVFRFQNQTKEWIQLGSDLVGDSAGVQAGYSMDLLTIPPQEQKVARIDEEDDKEMTIVVAIGSWTAGDYLSGMVRVYEYNAEFDFWFRLGQDLWGDKPAIFFGTSISMSLRRTTTPDSRTSNQGDLLLIAIGADLDSTYAANGGRVQVFGFRQGGENEWTKVGQSIFSARDHDRLGSDVVLSGSGQVLAMGIPSSLYGLTGKGAVRFFQWNPRLGRWTGMGSTVTGYFQDRSLTSSIDLSYDGTVAVMKRLVVDNDGDLDKSIQILTFNATMSEWTKQYHIVPATNRTLNSSGQSIIGAFALSPNGKSLAVARQLLSPKDTRTGTTTALTVVEIYRPFHDSTPFQNDIVGSSNSITARSKPKSTATRKWSKKKIVNLPSSFAASSTLSSSSLVTARNSGTGGPHQLHLSDRDTLAIGCPECKQQGSAGNGGSAIVVQFQ